MQMKINDKFSHVSVTQIHDQQPIQLFAMSKLSMPIIFHVCMQNTGLAKVSYCLPAYIVAEGYQLE